LTTLIIKIISLPLRLPLIPLLTATTFANEDNVVAGFDIIVRDIEIINPIAIKLIPFEVND